MAPRVLVCIDDAGVAHVVAARLMRDGLEGVVVERPGLLVDEARRGAAAVVVQDKYPSGEAVTTLLRQLRVARSEVVPAVILTTAELAQGDRHVLEKQYRVREFLPVATSPIKIAEALRAAAGNLDDETVLHEDERKNEFDISVESGINNVGRYDSPTGGFSLDAGVEARTVEVSADEIKRMRAGDLRPTAGLGLHPQPVTQEGAASDSPNGRATAEGLFAGARAGMSDLSELPAPGGDMDVEFGADWRATDTQAQASAPLADVFNLDDVVAAANADPPNASTSQNAKTSIQPTSGLNLMSPSPLGDEGDPVQIQDLQKTNNELRAQVLRERKNAQVAQKRIEELEAKVARGGDGKERTLGPGVPTEGVFEELRYPALLARCRAEAFTGAIQMQSGGALRTVFLRDGLPVAFHSSEPGERIGKVLSTQGRITEAQYGSATVRSVERSIKLTDALVELGYMDAETIAVEQRNLTRDQIIQSFDVVQGRFTVQAAAAPDAQTATFDFGPGEIYVQGFRRNAPATEMMATYETLRDKYLIANARLAGYRPKLGLVGEDERLLRLFGEALTVEEAVERAQVTPEQASRLIAALQALELVDEWSPGVEQFRSRIRHERQRHAEDIAQLHAEAKRREERMLDAFETALKKLGSSLNFSPTATEEPRRPFGGSASPFSSPPAAPQQPAPAGPTTALPASTSSIMSGVGGPSNSAAAAPSASSTASATNKPVSSVTAGPLPDEPISIKARAEPATDKEPSKSTQSGGLSLADLKYSEGIEQASQNRLDEAEVTLREAVRLDASKPQYLTSLARVLLGNPRYERAGTLPVVRSLLDRAVQIAPDFQEAADLHRQVMREMQGNS